MSEQAKHEPTPEIWTDEQVANLNAYQKAGRFHPFTCPGDHDRCEKQRDLVATREGWVCACGEYRQGWAHDFMMKAATDAN